MENEVLERQFHKMGARIKFSPAPRWGDSVRINILKDKKGEYFELQAHPDADVQVVDIQPKDRHLLLMLRENEDKQKLLCGHDERSWFVASLPGRISGVSNVKNAKEALKPTAVLEEQNRKGIRTKDRSKRHTEAYIRQGEWFFLPRPDMKVDSKMILSNEPIQAGSKKPHMCQYLYRTGGTLVYVGPGYGNGLTVEQYQALPDTVRSKHYFRTMMRDAGVYVKGTIRHPDHKTLVLPCWHFVQMNTEGASRNVAFLD